MVEVDNDRIGRYFAQLSEIQLYVSLMAQEASEDEEDWFAELRYHLQEAHIMVEDLPNHMS